MKVHVTAVVSGAEVPSTRFRILQHVERLHALGVVVDARVPRISKYAPLPITSPKLSSARVLHRAWTAMKLAARVPALVASWKTDVCWLERNVIVGRTTIEGLAKRPLVLDIDDAIWLETPDGQGSLRRNLSRAAVVFAGNRYLAERCSDVAARVRIIPTAIDTGRFAPDPDREHRSDFVIGWTGSSSNFDYLRQTIPALLRMTSGYRDVRLVIVADKPPPFPAELMARTRFLPWSPESELAVRHFDVGLMPLADSEWARGKCSFKMLQYMAVGAVPVVSPIGMNSDLLAMGDVGIGATTADDFYDGLSELYRNSAMRRRMSNNGQRIVSEHFCASIVSRQIAREFQSLV